MSLFETKPATVFTVSSLTKELQELLQEKYDWVQVRGEISNLKQAASGHLYFSLKDQDAIISCVAWRSTAARWSGLNLQDGMAVVAGGSISLYPPRGQYQLVVSSLRLEGVGALQIQYEAVKQRLFEEGLFAEEHKKNLPLFPQKIAVVTSPTGAALRDFLRVLHQNKFPVPVMVCPVLVQGNEAAGQIAGMLERLNQNSACDVIVLTRGGGSLEDLWPFNEEVVARAVHRSKIPVISAIGHEIDFSISDFVADVRASTPTAAAQILCSIFAEHAFRMRHKYEQLTRSILPHIQQKKDQLSAMENALRRCHPKMVLSVHKQRLDEWFSRLTQSMLNRVAAEKKSMQIQQSVLSRTILHNIRQTQQSVERMRGLLESHDIQKTLARGYSICRDTEGNIVTGIEQLQVDEILSIRVHNGKIFADVRKLESNG